MDEFDARNKHEESEEDGLRVTWQRVLAVRLFLYVEECVCVCFFMFKDGEFPFLSFFIFKDKEVSSFLCLKIERFFLF